MRQRTTWRNAAAAPAIPTVTDGHPAAKPDPAIDAFAKGDPSAWAEDVHHGPYTPVPPPSIPHEASARKASLMRAARCVKLAEALLGPKAAEAQIQSQAIAMMDWDDQAIDNGLSRMDVQVTDDDLDVGGLDLDQDIDSLDFDDLDLDDDQAIAPLEWDAATPDAFTPDAFEGLDMDNSGSLSPDEFDDFDADAVLAEMEAEEASKKTAALERRVASLEAKISRMASILLKATEDKPAEDAPAEDEEADKEGGKKAGEDSEEDKPAEDNSDEEDGKQAGEDPEEEDPAEDESGKEADLQVSFDQNADPMTILQGDDSLQALYRQAGEDTEDEETRQAARQAAQRAGKGRTASPKTLGNVRVASQSQDPLESLWATAPNLKDYF